MKKLLTVLLLFAAAAAVFAKDVKIDLKNAVIVVKTGSQKGIAEDLKTHLELIGGGKVAIVPASKIPAGKYVFHVGTAPKGTKETFKPEEGRYVITDKAAYFFGDPRRNQGISHAVYTFLDEALCVRWPSPRPHYCCQTQPCYRKQNGRKIYPCTEHPRHPRSGYLEPSYENGQPQSPPVWSRFHQMVEQIRQNPSGIFCTQLR